MWIVWDPILVVPDVVHQIIPMLFLLVVYTMAVELVGVLYVGCGYSAAV